jgi:hypothetical protein
MIILSGDFNAKLGQEDIFKPTIGNESSYEDHFPKYHIMILLDFNVKLGRGNIFKLTIGNESLHEDNNDNGVGVVNFATLKS